LALIADLWDSFSDAEPPTPLAQRQELARRVANFGQDKGQPCAGKT
jgi:putative addiction module component (TIGR02574 family)